MTMSAITPTFKSVRALRSLRSNSDKQSPEGGHKLLSTACRHSQNPPFIYSRHTGGDLVTSTRFRTGLDYDPRSPVTTVKRATHVQCTRSAIPSSNSDQPSSPSPSHLIMTAVLVAVAGLRKVLNQLSSRISSELDKSSMIAAIEPQGPLAAPVPAMLCACAPILPFAAISSSLAPASAAFVADLRGNPTFMCGLIAWAMAQGLKVRRSFMAAAPCTGEPNHTAMGSGLTGSTGASGPAQCSQGMGQPPGCCGGRAAVRPSAVLESCAGRPGGRGGPLGRAGSPLPP